MSCSKVKIVNSRPESNFKFSVLQGSTTGDSTLIRVVYPKKLKVNYHVTNSSGEKLFVNRVKSFTQDHSVFKIEHIRVSNLSLSETYTLKITSDKRRWHDERKFRALDIQKKTSKF